MTLEEFTRDIVPIIGLLSLIAVWWQLDRTNRWNKINFTYNMINSGRMGVLENAVIENFSSHNINIVRIEKTDESHLQLIKDNQNLNNALCEYLNYLENFCIGITKGAAEKEIAFEAMSENVICAWDRYGKYILWHRGDSEDIYSELEKYAKKWKTLNRLTIANKSKRDE